MGYKEVEVFGNVFLSVDGDEDWEQALIDEYIEMQKEQKASEAKK